MTLFRKMATSFVLLIGFSSGCFWGGNGEDQWTRQRPPVYPTKGIVTLDGQPLEKAVVIFRSQEKGVAATGVTDANGTFKLTSYKADDGAVADHFLVAVSKHEAPEPPSGYNSDTMPPLPPAKLVTPAKYAEFSTSGLEATVVEKGENTFEFRLESK
ncbi:MAG TPA: carboxypeptidase-like regulatory domain-containing protein [Planctomicrobium sp.]|nr:carboxypeptidase-like regulatory domain-containing protein [Planctomicrobium sp.]